MLKKFFQQALLKASGIAGKPARLITLLSQLTLKLRDVDWSNVKTTDAKDKMYVLGRMVRAYATGTYKEIPWQTLLIIVAAIVYFLNPIDFIPDFIPIAGFTDDFAVLLWVYKSVKSEIDKFLTWEKLQVSIS